MCVCALCVLMHVCLCAWQVCVCVLIHVCLCAWHVCVWGGSQNMAGVCVRDREGAWQCVSVYTCMRCVCVCVVYSPTTHPTLSQHSGSLKAMQRPKG